MTKRKPLCPRTLRYVARRMRAYFRHYDAKELSKATDAAFAAGCARMARRVADECLGEARAIEKANKGKR